MTPLSSIRRGGPVEEAGAYLGAWVVGDPFINRNSSANPRLHAAAHKFCDQLREYVLVLETGTDHPLRSG
jgi:hypothetical protein